MSDCKNHDMRYHYGRGKDYLSCYSCGAKVEAHRLIEDQGSHIEELEAKLAKVREIAKEAKAGDQYDSTCHWAIHEIVEVLEKE